MTVSTRRQVFRWCAGAATAALMTGAAGRVFAAPQVMNPWDLALYREVFAAIDRGDFIDAQMQMLEVKDRSLSGYVSFRQLMHPTAHVSSFEELSRWLAERVSQGLATPPAGGAAEQRAMSTAATAPIASPDRCSADSRSPRTNRAKAPVPAG